MVQIMTQYFLQKVSLLLFVVLLAAPLAVQAQQTITGRVTGSDDDNGLPGASILIKGTVIGGLTDRDGHYSLQAFVGDVLIFSFVGYGTQEIAISEGMIEESTAEPVLVIDVILQVAVEQLRDIVVIANGAEANRRALSYSVQRIKTEEFIGSDQASFAAKWKTQVPGVEIFQPSGVGASSTIRIRASASILRSNAPLVVMDGVPFDINNSQGITINPHDIDSITVLKGPSATVLYGSRAGNGVIIITTKGG